MVSASKKLGLFSEGEILHSALGCWNGAFSLFGTFLETEYDRTILTAQADFVHCCVLTRQEGSDMGTKQY
jgi:hypothetical protein